MRVLPPVSGRGAELGTHLLQVKVKVRFVWAGLQLKGPCRGPVVAAPGVEDERTRRDLQIEKITFLPASLIYLLLETPKTPVRQISQFILLFTFIVLIHTYSILL